MKKIINPWRNHPEYNCFGCCPDNPIGLHLEFYEDGDYIVSKWHPQHNYQGWVNTMHGGIVQKGYSDYRTRTDDTSKSREKSNRSLSWLKYLETRYINIIH
jgi:hypothetical protein